MAVKELAFLHISFHRANYFAFSISLGLISKWNHALDLGWPWDKVVKSVFPLHTNTFIFNNSYIHICIHAWLAPQRPEWVTWGKANSQTLRNWIGVSSEPSPPMSFLFFHATWNLSLPHAWWLCPGLVNDTNPSNYINMARSRDMYLLHYYWSLINTFTIENAIFFPIGHHR